MPLLLVTLFQSKAVRSIPRERFLKKCEEGFSFTYGMKLQKPLLLLLASLFLSEMNFDISVECRGHCLVLLPWDETKSQTIQL